MVFKCFDEVDKTAWLYFLFAGIKPDFVDFFHTFAILFSILALLTTLHRRFT